MADEVPELAYPVLLWREGYTYLAATPLELCAHPRSMFADTVNRAKAGEWRLADSRGRCFEVLDWARREPFGGVKGFGMRLLGSVFAAPVLANETQLSLAEFKKRLVNALRSRYRHDGDKSPGADATRKVRAAQSFEAVIQALPRL